jgi:hypothetical protein
VLDPSNLRVGIAGNILELAGPKKVLADKFLSFKVSHAHLSEIGRLWQESKPLNPISLSSATLSELGKNPSKKVSPQANIVSSAS